MKTIVILALAATAAHRTPRCDSKSGLRVLFIGNSYTYVNNVPRQLEQIAAALPGPCISAQMIAVGGATLRQHWMSDSVVRRIADGHWTDVVIQDQSTFGEQWWVTGTFRVPASAPELAEFGSQFVREIRKAKARPTVLAHWSDDGAPARDQQALDFAFRALTASGAAIAPVGDAIKEVARDSSFESPYFTDGHHLSATGSYLEALVLYRSLTGRSVVGAPHRIDGPAVDFQGGSVFKDSTVTLVDLQAQSAAKLQHQVATHFVAWRNKVERAEQPVSLEAEFPAVNPGAERLDLAELAGRWTGTTNVLPSPGNQDLVVEAVIGGTADSLYLRLPGMEYAGPVATTVDNGVLILKGSVLPRGRSRRGSEPVPFDVTVQAARVGNAFHGIARAHQAGNGTMPSLDAIGQFTIKR